MNAALTCAHCALPIGRLAQQREVAGDPCWFCCYGCCLAYQVHHGAADEHDAAAALIRLGVGAFLAMNVMLFSLLLYAGAFAGVDAWLRLPVVVLLWILATPLVVILGGPFFAGAGKALRAGRLTTDSLVSIGVLAAYVYSAVQVVRGSDVVYFDTASMVLVLFTLGRYLEAQGRAQAARCLAPMLAAERAEVLVLDDRGDAANASDCGPATGTRQTVRSVLPGMRVRVLPGERIAVDGVVVDGRSACDESILTGQPQPRAKGPGDLVFAGSVNGNGPLLIRATVAGTQTRWVHISRMVREALARKSMTAEAVDRAVAVFIPGVLLLAFAAAWYWSSHADADTALLAALAVLVVACPCALGLAAPLAGALAIGAAAQRGILIRGGAVLERLATLKVVAFDKTGTLTRGELRPHAVHVAGATENDAIRRACALAQGSDHPVARAVLALGANESGTNTLRADGLEVRPGQGVLGSFDGMPAALGSAAWMRTFGWTFSQSLHEPSGGAATSVFVGWDGAVRARFSFDDAPVVEARAVISALRERGLATLLLSGDAPAAVAQIAAALGIPEWRAQQMPEDKARYLRLRVASAGAVAMVGDGLNDGPVLAAASVGIAVGHATDLAKESADVILPPGGLAGLPWLLELAAQARLSVRTNVAWAFGYNAITLSLAASGLLQPVLAAALMAGSSVVVVWRAWRAGQRYRSSAAPPSQAATVAVEQGSAQWAGR